MSQYTRKTSHLLAARALPDPIHLQPKPRYIKNFTWSFIKHEQELCYSVKRSRLADEPNFKFKYNFAGNDFLFQPRQRASIALWNAFSCLCAQFSLFRLALFPFQLKASAADVFHVVRLLTIAMRTCSRNFLFLPRVM